MPHCWYVQTYADVADSIHNECPPKRDGTCTGEARISRTQALTCGAKVEARAVLPVLQTEAVRHALLLSVLHLRRTQQVTHVNGYFFTRHAPSVQQSRAYASASRPNALYMYQAKCSAYAAGQRCVLVAVDRNTFHKPTFIPSSAPTTHLHAVEKAHPGQTGNLVGSCEGG